MLSREHVDLEMFGQLQKEEMHSKRGESPAKKNTCVEKRLASFLDLREVGNLDGSKTLVMINLL